MISRDPSKYLLQRNSDLIDSLWKNIPSPWDDPACKRLLFPILDAHGKPASDIQASGDVIHIKGMS